jgi:hypothetical protein
LRARSLGGIPPDYVTCEAAVRSYAHGLYASGETDRAVQTMLRSPDPTPSLRSFHERIGAIFLLADGRTDEAIGIIRAAPRLPKQEGVYRACMLLRTALPRGITTRMVLNAFEISRTDSSSLRDLARCLELGNRRDTASEF